MASTRIFIGLGILGLGAVIGFFGATTPITSAAQQTIPLINTVIVIAPNDYSTQSLQLIKGETVQLALSIENQTIFTFDIMNQSQFYVYNNCAPKCMQPLLGGSGAYYQQAGEVEPTQVNVTVSPSSPYSGEFMAPANGTYYFVFDNSIGPTGQSYSDHNVTGATIGQFSLSSTQSVTNSSVNWVIVGLGAIVTISGGGAASGMWETKPKSKAG